MTDRDHRTRVAAARRERTRTRLIESAFLVFGERGVEATIIDELIGIAGVSRGTFYNYFRTNEELLSAVIIEVSNEMMRIVDPIVQQAGDPAQRVSDGIRLNLALVAQIPQLGAFLARGALTMPNLGGNDELVAKFLPRDLATGIETGRFTLRDPRLAFDIVIGPLLAALLSSRLSAYDPSALTAAILRGLGLPAAEAETIAGTPLAPLKLSPDSLLVRAVRN